jgi:hypothetical protein
VYEFGKYLGEGTSRGNGSYIPLPSFLFAVFLGRFPEDPPSLIAKGCTDLTRWGS